MSSVLLASTVTLALCGCGTSEVLHGTSLNRVADAVREERLGFLGDAVCVESWTEQAEEQGISFIARSSGSFDLLAPLVSLGMWIICDARFTITVETVPGGVRLRVRRLAHHQLLLVLPLIYGDAEYERAFIARIRAHISRS